MLFHGIIRSYILERWQEMGSEGGERQAAKGNRSIWTMDWVSEDTASAHETHILLLWYLGAIYKLYFNIQFCLEIDLSDFYLQNISQWDALSTQQLLKLLNLVRKSDWYQQLTE